MSWAGSYLGMLGLLKEAAIGGVMGGLAGTAFYGAGKALGFLKDSIRDVRGKGSSLYKSNSGLKYNLQFFAEENVDSKTNFIVTSKGTVMDTSKNYNLIGTGKKGDWFQIHNWGKEEIGFDFPHTHSPKINTNGVHVSVNRVISNTTDADINLADKLLRTGQMILRKGRK